MRRLTAKQEAFAQAIVEGEKQGAAYRKSFNWRGDIKVSNTRASELIRLPHVAARVAELREKMETPRTLERIQKRIILAEIVTAQDDGATLDHRLKAIEIDNKMAGHNEPEQLKVTGLGSILQKIRASARKP